VTVHSEHVLNLLKTECSDCKRPGQIFAIELSCHCRNADCENEGQNYYNADIPEEVAAKVLQLLDEAQVLTPLRSSPMLDEKNQEALCQKN
jgi:hypothetical protein